MVVGAVAYGALDNSVQFLGASVVTNAMFVFAAVFMVLGSISLANCAGASLRHSEGSRLWRE